VFMAHRMRCMSRISTSLVTLVRLSADHMPLTTPVRCSVLVESSFLSSAYGPLLPFFYQLKCNLLAFEGAGISPASLLSTVRRETPSGRRTL
jgi:hypothetical protein